MDFDEVKQRQSYAWGQGDYSRISKMLEPASSALCEAMGVASGEDVLDVAAGDGNFALAAARAGARVVASDMSPVMLERGRARSIGEGYEMQWVEADAEELPFDDESFDRVGSVFGAMIAPRPEKVAAELFRVTRPGGSVGMTAWTPASFSVELFSIARRYQPPGPDVPRLEQWGEEDTARARFGDLAAELHMERRAVRWEAASLEEFEQIERNTPMCATLRQVLPEEQVEAMHAEQLDLVRRRTGGGEGPIAIDTEYLMIVARKPGQP